MGIIQFLKDRFSRKCSFCKRKRLWFTVKKRTYAVMSVAEIKGLEVTSELPMCNKCFDLRPIK